MSPPKQGSWLGRNWWWAAPLGCLLPALACGGCFALILPAVFGAIKSSDPYKEGVVRAKASAAVRDALGEPIAEGYFPSGNINTRTTNGVESGTADLTIPLSGPKGSGAVHVVAEKAAGKWTYSTIEATPRPAVGLPAPPAIAPRQPARRPAPTAGALASLVGFWLDRGFSLEPAPERLQGLWRSDRLRGFWDFA
jgi:hypothetical protein